MSVVSCCHIFIAYREEKCDNNKGNTSCCHIFIAYRAVKCDNNKVTLHVVTFSLPIGKKNVTTKLTLHVVTFSLPIGQKNVTTAK